MEFQISPEQKKLIIGYKEEALLELGNKEQAATAFKDIVTAAHETTNISKKIIGKYFKICYADKVNELTEEAGIIGFLDD